MEEPHIYIYTQTFIHVHIHTSIKYMNGSLQTSSKEPRSTARVLKSHVLLWRQLVALFQGWRKEG